MQIVPVQALPNQSLQVQLDGQACSIDLVQTDYGLFMSLAVNGSAPVSLNGVLCENLNRVVRSLYIGFVGDFVFVDTQGSDDPIYTWLGTRFQLIYLEASDLLPGEG